MSTSLSIVLLSAALQAAAPPGEPGTAGPVEPGAAGPIAGIAGLDDVEVTLRGSPESVARQHAVAVAGGYTFVGTLEEMELLAEQGHLDPVYGGDHYEVMEWVFPYALPEIRTFVERTAWEYRQACGEALVVTSLTRPFSEQPPNAHQLSVHPAGMAVDLRIPQTPACREFIEARMLEKEEAGLLDITHERSPPHYHVAVFPGAYMQWEALQPPLPEAAAPARELPPPPQREGALLLMFAAVFAAVVAAAATWFYFRRRQQPPPAE